MKSSLYMPRSLGVCPLILVVPHLVLLLTCVHSAPHHIVPHTIQRRTIVSMCRSIGHCAIVLCVYCLMLGTTCLIQLLDQNVNCLLLCSLQERAKASKPRDWEQLTESYITKAAMAHAPAKLLAMRSTVPNTSSRMVFQSRAPSMQPDMDFGLDKSSSSHSSSPEKDSPRPQQQLESPKEVQRLLDMPDAVDGAGVPLGSAQAVSGVPSTPPVQQLAELVRQVNMAAQQVEQLSQDEGVPVTAMQSPADASKRPRDLRGIMRLAPLMIPTPHSPEEDQKTPATTSDATPGTVSNQATDATVASLAGKHQHQPAVQGVSARNQAAIAVHQARLAALHQKDRARQAHSWGNAPGHAPAPAAHHTDSPLLSASEPDSQDVQHSAASATRVSAPIRLKPALRKHSSVADLSSSSSAPRQLSPLSSPRRPAEEGQSVLGSPRGSAEREGLSLDSPSRLSSPSRPARSLETDQALRSILRSGGADDSYVSGSVSPSKRTPNR